MELQKPFSLNWFQFVHILDQCKIPKNYEIDQLAEVILGNYPRCNLFTLRCFFHHITYNFESPYSNA